MSPLEHATSIATRFGSPGIDPVGFSELQTVIHQAILACCNEELERHRAVERQLENVRAGGLSIFAEKDRTQLRVWNPIRKCWAVTDMIHMPEAQS